MGSKRCCEERKKRSGKGEDERKTMKDRESYFSNLKTYVLFFKPPEL